MSGGGWTDLTGIYHEGNPYIPGHCNLHPDQRCWPDSPESTRDWVMRKAAHNDDLSDDAFVIVARALRGEDLEGGAL